MNLTRLPHEPGALVDFYQRSLEHLGAVSERTWFDRLQLVAEGRAARLWNDTGALHETELRFPDPGQAAPRDAACEVFPGCPLTFHLAEALRPSPPVLERAVLAVDRAQQPPAPAVVENLWHAQSPTAGRWRLDPVLRPAHHFSLLLLARCEIQAIDQHWSLHRIALMLPGGEADEALAANLDFADLVPQPTPEPAWPACDPVRWHGLISEALGGVLAAELQPIRQRQESYLRRELDRIDDYFSGYAQELSDRAARTRSEATRVKVDERLAAARAEHARRRADQVQRHEIRILPRVDALLLLAEPAWRTTATLTHHGETRVRPALFVPRSRRWHLDEPSP